MDRPIEGAILGSEAIIQTKAQVAGFLHPDLLLRLTMGPRIAEAGVTSIIHNGLRLDLVAAVRRALLHIAVVRKRHRLVLFLQMTRFLLGHPSLGLNLRSHIGIIKVKMSGLCRRLKMMALMTWPRLPVILV